MNLKVLLKLEAILLKNNENNRIPEAVRFDAIVKDGMIEIPEKYKELLESKHVKIIAMIDDNENIDEKK